MEPDLTPQPDAVVLHARADVAKCDGGDLCVLGDSCSRWLRPPARFQVYSSFPGWRTMRCQGYVPV